MKHTIRKAALAALTLALAALAGCGAAPARDNAGGLSVVATVFAPYDFARELAGDRGEVTLLLPPGAEAHGYEPTPQDILAIEGCDLFVYVGGASDAWVAGVLDSLDAPPRVLTLMDCVEPLEEESVEGMQAGAHEHDGHGHGAAYDEHVWTSPRNAARICETLCAALGEAAPADAAYFEERLAAYLAELEALDAAFAGAVENGARDTLVFADRFPLLYFVRAYGLGYYAAFPGCADETEPSAATVAFLEDRVREAGIPVVFHIELSNEDLADAICADTGAAKRQWNACHNVSAAQLAAGVSYLSLMWENVDALKEALA